MPPHQQDQQPPTITPPPTLPHPLLPRQDFLSYNQNDISSIYALISSLYDPALYSAYTYDYNSVYSSLLSEFATLYPSYSLPTDINEFLATATATDGAPSTRRTRVDGGPTATGTGAALSNVNNNNGNGNNNGSNDNNGNAAGLSTGAKIGIGVGVPLAVGLIVGIAVFLWCARKRKGRSNGFAQPGPQQGNFVAQGQLPQQQQQQIYAPGPQGYIQGYPASSPPQQTPPPMYMVPHGQEQGQVQAQYAAYPKEMVPQAVELEQEYHFARPGVVEMDSGTPGEGQR
ncbi:uncharacterized protein EI97DRAFT_431343 [Westerdykella ornata]|uniref:Uncharacterized protein n=1 Tax=Westerdykella ornata TaxID=318751 RepID=A0A6A6JSQ4_WESOR|nr:uncharacterized protein EI97DRAFT_431343 [Westerdykella ornata]KAF2279143.1 hypothetical protein EI97DRAFT_431343 [Westerdykella ornata]